MNRRSSACRQDRHRARHLLCPGAVCGFGRLRHVQEKVNIFHIRLISHSLIIRRVTSVLIKLVLFFSPFSQTQGPSGPIYASSNPEYLSTDGKQGLGLLSTTEYLMILANLRDFDNLVAITHQRYQRLDPLVCDWLVKLFLVDQLLN